MKQRKEFERVTPESVGIRSESIERFLDKLESSGTEMHGLMLMRHGKICAEGWWNPYAPGVRHGLQSLSKTYAATAVGLAYTEGLLRLDEPVLDIFPEDAPAQPCENLKKLTVRDVLCMGCGMDEMPPPTEHWIRDFLATPVTHAPGTTYFYNSMGSTLLGAMVRKRAGVGLHAYLTPRLFEKLGIDADNLRWLTLPDGMEIGGGGLFATTEDNLRLMKLYADGGVWEGEQLLSPEYVRLATTLQNASASEALHNPEAFDNFVGYGFQLWMCRPAGVYRADGAMGQFAIVAPEQDVLLSLNETAPGAHWAQNTLNLIWEFLGELNSGAALAEHPAASAHLAQRLRRLALPAPRFAPHSPLEPTLDGKAFCVKSGRICLENDMVYWMTGRPASAGFTEFSFSFAGGGCTLQFRQDGETHRVEIALDGTRRRNVLRLGDSCVSELLLHGFWSAENTLCVAARWAETCFEKQLVFTFAPQEVSVRENATVGAFGAGAPDNAARALAL